MAQLFDIIQRQMDPEPWSEGDNIPWNDPEFSRRMLREHLTQEHDAASRRSETIDKHVAWIHNHLLHGSQSRILDLGCGPGFYSNRLTALGHQCTGIDFSPASIEYARTQAAHDGLDIQYIESDIRDAEFGAAYDLVMLIFGEFNVFRPADAELLLQKIRSSLKPGGVLLLEPHTFDIVRQIGQWSPSWYSANSGLFSDLPHFVLTERFWREDAGTATIRHYVVDVATAEVTACSQSMQAYTDQNYRELLENNGFERCTFYPSLLGQTDPDQNDLIAITARRKPDP